ncbi:MULTISPECIES: hypothetical protein [Listeria]|uniref:hypothetical protein n=1 Tax=Listeria TaxID=1637 RepID=UPI000B58DEC9|nr:MULTISPECIES: hypothetical protein [Listeria]
MKLKQIDKAISEIAFQLAEKNLNEQIIQSGIKGKENSLISYSLKKMLLFIGTFIAPIIFFSALTSYDMNQVPEKNLYIFWTILLIFIAIVLLSSYVYFKVTRKNPFPYLNQFNFRLLLFLLVEISVVGYSSIMLLNFLNNNSPILIEIILVLYYFIVYRLVKLVISTQIIEELNDSYNSKLNIKNWQQLLSRFPIILFIIMIIAMQGYRVSKSLFIVSHESSLMTDLYYIVGDLGAVLMAICIGLLPTILFNRKIFVRGLILRKYSDEFRKKYQLTERAWYGEK